MLRDAEEILGTGEEGDEKSSRFDGLRLSSKEAGLPHPRYCLRTSSGMESAFKSLVCRMADLPALASAHAACSKDMGVV